MYHIRRATGAQPSGEMRELERQRSETFDVVGQVIEQIDDLLSRQRVAQIMLMEIIPLARISIKMMEHSHSMHNPQISA